MYADIRSRQLWVEKGLRGVWVGTGLALSLYVYVGFCPNHQRRASAYIYESANGQSRLTAICGSKAQHQRQSMLATRGAKDSSNVEPFSQAGLNQMHYFSVDVAQLTIY